MPDIFTYEQGNLLIRLLLAHILADFVFQTKDMADSKKWFSGSMFLHITVVFGLTWLFGGRWLMSVLISVLHWLTDCLKIFAKKKFQDKDTALFAADQLTHLVIIILIWAVGLNIYNKLHIPAITILTNYKFSLYILGYALVIWPLGYLLKFFLKKLSPGTPAEKIENGGQLIGQFERIIILSFVLLGQYEAIGFLITGKGLIRFTDKDRLSSEYVLLGTMMSYALCILTGLLINWLLA